MLESLRGRSSATLYVYGPNPQARSITNPVGTAHESIHARAKHPKRAQIQAPRTRFAGNARAWRRAGIDRPAAGLAPAPGRLAARADGSGGAAIPRPRPRDARCTRDD